MYPRPGFKVPTSVLSDKFVVHCVECAGPNFVQLRAIIARNCTKLESLHRSPHDLPDFAVCQPISGNNKTAKN